MKTKTKTLLGVTLTALVVSGTALILREPSEPEEKKPKAEKSELLMVVDDSDHPLQSCIPENAAYKDTILKVENYSLISYTFEVPKPKPGVKHKDNHRHGASPPHPNFNVAIGVVDPFEGCKPTIKNMLFEPMPQSWPEKQRVLMKKAFWIAYLKEVQEQLNITPQSWLDIQTHYSGPSEMSLQDDDVKALNALGRKLPKWYDLSLPEEERHSLRRARPVPKPYVEGERLPKHEHGKDKGTPE